MQAAGLGRSGPAGKRPLRASRGALDAADASGACQRHGRAATPVRGSGGKTEDMPEKGANGPGRTAGRPRKMAGRPRKTAAPPKKPAKPPPAAGAGGRACNQRAGGPEGSRATPPEGPPEGLPAAPETAPKPSERSPRPGEKDPDRQPRAGTGAGVRTKTGGGRRRREKTEMQQQNQGETPGPCAWRYSPPPA